MKQLIIVPAFNEAPVIFATLTNLQRTVSGFDIIVVDDGSTDATAHQARRAKVKVLHHALNRGLGGALGTGLEFAKRRNYDLAVTFDADGQHDPRDILTAIRPILTGSADVVIGSRTRGHGHMPLDRQLLNWLGNVLTWLMFGIWTSDSQSGFRAFSKPAIQTIEVKTEGMEVSSEFFAEVKRHKLKVTEVPIKVIYTDYSRAKGQSNLNAVNVLVKLLLRLVR